MPSVKLDLHKLVYEQSGEGPALVLLHGIGSNRLSWKRQLSGLSQDFTVLAWDAPGYGLSSDPVSNSPNIGEYADCVAAWITHLKLSPVHLLGHSFGGIIAQETYGKYPDLIKTLILANTSLGGGAEDAKTNKAKLKRRLQKLDELGVKGLAAERSTKLFSKAAPGSVISEAASIMGQVRPLGYRFAVQALAKADERATLTSVNVPTLLVWSDEDKVISKTQTEEVCRALPSTRFEIISAAGHLCYQEKPEVFNQLVRDFCLSHS